MTTENCTHLPDEPAARILGTTSATLRKSRVTGELWGCPAPQFVKFGRTVRYRADDLERWLQENGKVCTSTADARLGGASA